MHKTDVPADLRGQLDDHFGEVTVAGGVSAYLLFAFGVMAHHFSPTLAFSLLGFPPLFLIVVALGAFFTVRLLVSQHRRES